MNKDNKLIFCVITIMALICVIIVSLYLKKKEQISPTENNSNTKSTIQNNDNVFIDNTKVTISIGQTENNIENYNYINEEIDKTLSKEEQIKTIINFIGTAIGYNIETNSIKIEGKNILIDFKNTSAPFETTESYIGNNEEKYQILQKNAISKIIFDSISKTLLNYFGNSPKIYFSVNNENISINDIEIDKNLEYNPVN